MHANNPQEKAKQQAPKLPLVFAAASHFGLFVVGKPIYNHIVSHGLINKCYNLLNN